MISAIVSHKIPDIIYPSKREMEMTRKIPLKYAETFSPEQCRKARDENMLLARRARLPRDNTFFRINNKIVVSAVRRAKMWHRSMLAGGSESYRYWQSRPSALSSGGTRGG